MKVASILVRIVMVGVWFGILVAFLFTPYLALLWSHKKTLNLCIWPMMVDPRVLKDFERETGIKVNVNYYENNEELYSKLKITNGRGYDLIVPTDYIVQDLIDDGLIKKIDSSRLNFMHTLKPYLLHHYYDPHALYSIPYYISFFGLGINRDYVKLQNAPSWGMLFESKYALPSLCMTDVQRESIMLAAYYLYGSTDVTDGDRLEKIVQLLCEQKKFVDIYSSTRVDELLASGSCAVAVGSSTEVGKAMRECSNIDFVIPQEGSFITIDSFVIPAASTCDDLVYQFLNFLYRPDIMKRNSAHYGFCPPTNNVGTSALGVICPDENLIPSLHFFKSALPRDTMHELWITIKA